MTISEAENRAGGRRADARRNEEAILEAATAGLARNPDLTLKQIAEAAGIGRVTLYGHFDSRGALIEAVVDRAMAQTEQELAALDLSGDPRDVLARLMEVTWDLTHRFGALVAAAQRTLPADRFQDLHEAPAARVRKLLKRGRASGSFGASTPLAWQLAAIQSLLHGAADAVYRGELTARQVRENLPVTVLACLG